MYEQQFDAEWDDLSIDEATRRAYAIGVAKSLGKDFKTELEQIHAHFEAPYDRSLIELSYKEGRNRAKKKIGQGNDRSDVWNTLVADENLETVEPDDSRRGGQSIPTAIQRASMLDVNPQGTPSFMDLPEFLQGP